MDHIFGQIEVSLNEPQEVCKLVAEGRQLIKRRQKLIKLADTSKDGWLVVQEYESDELAFNSEVGRQRKERNLRLVMAMPLKGLNLLAMFSFFAVRPFYFLCDVSRWV